MHTPASRLLAAFAVSILIPVVLTISACSGDVAQIAVTLTPGFSGAFTPGTTNASFTVTVQNLGPGNASGVVVHANMPQSFQFAGTSAIISNGAARTSPEDASVGGSKPEWGVWSLSSPTSPNGKTDYASVAITFTVNITAAPNTYTMDAQVIDDNLTSTVQSHPLQVEVNEAPRLAVTASVGPGSVHPDGQVTYRVTVTNTGTGIAPGVDILVTLPPMLTYQSTIMPFQGNESIEQPIFPVKGALIVFYGGFELPPQTSLGPGKVSIEFIAQCIHTPSKGVFRIHVQVTDTLRGTVSISNAAPVTVFSS